METIFAGKWYLFPSRSLDVSHFVMEIIRCLGLCNQIVETDALRLHWELIFWVWFDLGRLLRETVSISFSLLKVFMLFTINLFTLTLWFCMILYSILSYGILCYLMVSNSIVWYFVVCFGTQALSRKMPIYFIKDFPSLIIVATGEA